MSRSAPFGFLACNKPRGMTSREVVNHVQRRLQLELGVRRLKVGHTGTLDPLADGIVVVAVGPATRLTPWMLQHAKRYRGRFQLGVCSVSGDLEQPVTARPELPMPTVSQLTSVSESLRGWVEQIPPAHSAVWVNGQRAYDRTRRGESVEMPTRQVWLGDVRVIDFQPPDLEVDVLCGSGTYLRSLGIDLAARCGTVAVMTALTRTNVGPLTLKEAVPAERFQTPPMHQLDERQREEIASATETRLLDQLHPPAPMLGHLPQLKLSEEDVVRVRNGLCVTDDPIPGGTTWCVPGKGSEEKPTRAGPRRADSEPSEESRGDAVAVDPRGGLVAVMRRKRSMWCPYRVFPAAI